MEHYLCICVQVSVDVFKGFPDEDSIVNYTLNQAYQDNVSVFASELSICVSCGHGTSVDSKKIK